jgi:hypothetical protein
MTALLATCARAGHGEVALDELKTALDVPEDQVGADLALGGGKRIL